MLLIIVAFIVVLTSATWTYAVGAPWLPTTFRTASRMLALAAVGPDDLVYDLGCGDGRMLVLAARRCGARAVGIEIDPLRYLWCQLLISVLGLRGRVRVVFGSFFRHSLAGADVVFCYLLPETNRKLEDTLKAELHPRARVVSNAFSFPGLKLIRQDGDARLYWVE